MVCSCDVPGCSNSQGIRPDLRFHSFPLKDEQLLETWKRMICRINWKPTKNHKVCSDHFVDNDYISTKRSNLKSNAIPSLLLPILCDHNSSNEEEHIIQDESSDNANIISSDSNSNNYQIEYILFDAGSENSEDFDMFCDTPSTASGMFHKGTQTAPNRLNVALTPNELILKKRIKTLQKTLQRREKKIGEMSKLLKKLMKSNTEDFLE